MDVYCHTNTASPLWRRVPRTESIVTRGSWIFPEA